ncbi:Ricin-type beta-trefoil lectin domain protein [compost metagenome]
MATAAALSGENAAPSEHLYFSFPSDAIAKLHKIKITQSANAEYFSVHNYAGGYAGLQQTPDNSFGTPNILISSLWDPNTAGGVYSEVAYTGSATISSRFGGEGDGYKTINPYQWELNTWYNLALRAWKLNGKLYIGSFIQNQTTGVWVHTSTLAIAERTQFLGSSNDAFLENWTGTNPAYDGSFIRKAFFKDCWNLSTNNTWEKHTSRSFSANAGDAGRNGIYDRAFNSGYDATEDAYFMEHGGNVQPGSGFGTGRTLTLPAQTNQGSAPTLTIAEVQSATATSNGNTVTVNWTNNQTKSPQFSSKVELLNPSGTVVSTINEVLPQKRSATISSTLGSGTYSVRITITDIFNQNSTPLTVPVTNGITANTWYKIKNASSGLYLAIENNSTANSAFLVQSTSATGNGQKWKFNTQGANYVIVNANSNKALDIAGGTQTLSGNIIQYTITSGANQQWIMLPVGTNKYVIQSNLSSHYVLDNPGSSTTSGTKIVQYSINGASGSANQQWILEAQ